jgi:glucokinase
MHLLGIDLGGTKTAVGVVDAQGKICKRLSFPSESSTFESYYPKLRSSLQAILTEFTESQNTIATIGVGCAGQIQPVTGLIRHSPNLGWRDAPLGARLRADFPDREITIDNDVRAATVGEYLFGFKERPSVYVNVFLGTGIGSGIIVYDRILRGASNSAGELGLTSICHNGPRSDSGNLGVFESYASGTALARYGFELIEKQLLEKPRLVGGSRFCDLVQGQNPSGQTIGKLAHQGHPEALSLVRKIGYFVGVGMVNLINFLNPEIITYGGGLANLGDPLIQMMLKTIKDRAIPSALKAVRIIPATLGSDAGMIGAAYLSQVDEKGRIQGNYA